MTFDPHWLAITRAMQPYFSLGMREIDPPFHQLRSMVQNELDRITAEGLLVPEIPADGQTNPLPTLVWEKGPIDVDRVQKFWPTAPAHGEPGGSDGTSRPLYPFSADDQWRGIRIHRLKLSAECWVSRTKSIQHLVDDSSCIRVCLTHGPSVRTVGLLVLSPRLHQGDVPSTA
jgi:hypothetical protein